MIPEASLENEKAAVPEEHHAGAQANVQAAAEPSAQQRAASRLVGCLPDALLCYGLTSVIVFVGASLGHDYLKRGETRFPRSADLIDVLNQWDGNWYQRIVRDGYSYDTQKSSNVAFFPLYPILGRLIVMLTGCSPALALVLVSNISFLAAFVALVAYLKRRLGDRYPEIGHYVLLAVGLFPTMFYYRMAYTESVFLLCSVLALYALEAKWSLPTIAFFVGLATAARPVGVALLIPLAIYLWRHSVSRRDLLVKSVLTLPLACWGIVAYVVYLSIVFEAPLAFAQTQVHWKARPPVGDAERMASLAILEPVWSVYTPTSPCCWARQEPGMNPLFSLVAANPVYFLLAIGLVALGWWKGWLNEYEISLAACLLVIPYVTRSHEMCMGSMGRFATAAFPMFLVMGHLLARAAKTLSIAILAWSGFFLGVYSAFFAAWYRFF